jgi:hypothetical protein
MVGGEAGAARGGGREDEGMRWRKIVNCCCHILAGTVKLGCFSFLFHFVFKGNYFRINYLAGILTQPERYL